MENKLGKIAEENRKVFTTNQHLEIGEVKILPFSTYHDAEEPVGYIVTKHDKKLAMLTDTGTVCKQIREHIKGADLVLLESNHDENMLMMGGYPYYLKQRIKSDLGHLSNEFCGQLITEVHEGKATYLLAHLSKENNTPDVAYETVKQTLIASGYTLGEDLELAMTHRDQPSKVYCL